MSLQWTSLSASHHCRIRAAQHHIAILILMLLLIRWLLHTRHDASLLQDAHEFLGTLLEQVQGEVLRREAAALGTPRVPVGATRCPASRTFSFCVEHQARLVASSSAYLRVRTAARQAVCRSAC